MDSLPWHLINEILFRVDLRSLAILRCTSRSFQSHISNDPYFKSQYFSRLGSGLLHISTYGSRLLCYHSLGDSRSLIKANLMECQILGSCSGLLLISIDSLCVANPLTKKFIFLNHPRSRKFHSRQQVYIEDKKFMGFAVDHVDRTTQSFKIVCMTEKRNANYETVYKFEINAGGSWRLSETRFTCRTSNLDDSMRSPIYLDGSLHWLRIDGSIVAFNPETEQARLIPINFPKKLSGTTLFSSDGKSLILISATEEVIYVYALENIVTDPKWVLVRRIPNGVLDKKRLLTWNVVAYDGKCLVLREYMYSYDRVVHCYDLRINKWGLMGSIPGWCDANLDFFQFTPSSSSVKGLNQDEQDVILGCEDDERFSSLSSIMGLAINGVDKFVSREENVSFG